MHTLGILAFLILLDFVAFRKGTLANPHLRTDWMAHLGGYGAGIAAGVLLLRRNQRLKEQKVNSKDGKVLIPPVSRALGKVS